MRAEYPFDQATGSFFLGVATPERLPPGPPLLAYGANASPTVLGRKLPGTDVAALVGTLRGWAVVHSRHVSPYGVVPATLVEQPGCAVAVHGLLLGDRAALDATEPNYERVALHALDLVLDVLGAVVAAEAYLSRHGPLLLDGAPVPLGSRSQGDLHGAVRRATADT